MVAMAAAVVALASCSDEPVDVAVSVDGGSNAVALLGEQVVTVDPGGTLTIRHDGAPAEAGDQAPVTHAFVGGGGEDLPPLFVGSRTARVPNPGVWGQCMGGTAENAGGRCPVPPVEGPDRWDGTVYWSSGALLPGESRELPLDEELPDEATLVCALHPRLQIVLRNAAATEGGDAVAADATEVPTGDDSQEAVRAALQAARDTQRRARVVSAGVQVDGAFVGRFVPNRVRIRAGQAVTWVAGGRAPVDVVFNAAPEELDLSHTTPVEGVPRGRANPWNGRGVLRSGFLSADPDAGGSGVRWRVRFSQPGRYRYASRFGAAYEGVVVVVR